MKKMGKWLLSLMVAVSLTMPVLADVNVQSTGTEFASEIGAAELQADTEQAIESQTEAEPESQTEPEEQTEEQTEDPVDVELDDYLNTSVVLQNASSIGFDRVQIQWQPFSLLEVEGYRIYRKTANSKWAVLADVTDTSYIDTTVENGQKYTYTVRAIQTFEGIRYLSQYDRNGVGCTAAPAAPVMNSQLNGYSCAVLTWNTVEDADFYRVYVKDTASGKWKNTAKVIGTSCQLTSLVCGRKYTYTVRAYQRVNGKELASAYNAQGIQIQTVPDTPVLNTPSANKDGSVKVSWQAAAGAAEYRVYRKTDAQGSFKLIGITKDADYTDKTAQGGRKNTYTVKAAAISGQDRSYSDYDHKGVFINVKLGAPKLKNISASGYNKITVGWTSVDGADGYNIYRKEAGGSWNRIVQVKDGQKTSYIDKTAKSSKVYIYTVRAYCQADGQTSLSGYNRTGVYWIDTPKMLVAEAYSEKSEIHHGQIDYDVLTGAKNVEGADGFYVYRKTNNGKWEKIDDCPVFTGSNAGPLYEKAEQTLFRDSTVRPGNSYTYTCRAYCKVNGKIILSGYDPKGSSVTVK